MSPDLLSHYVFISTHQQPVRLALVTVPPVALGVRLHQVRVVVVPAGILVAGYIASGDKRVDEVGRVRPGQRNEEGVDGSLDLLGVLRAVEEPAVAE